MMRALISVYNKEGIDEFALALHELGVEIVSTGGTFKRMKELGIPAIEVTRLTQYPEIMDGRVKTLNPNIHGGILAVRHNKNHMDKVKELNIPLIDIVVVNLYPFEATIADPNSTWDEIVEKIDIGGPSMIRSAAKNYEDVIVLVNPDRYEEVLSQLKESGNVSRELREKLAVEAFSHTAYYDSVISSYFRQKFPSSDLFPREMSIGLKKVQDLRYGENAHQQASLYRQGLPSGLITAKQLQGKELSFNNYLDTQAVYQMASLFDEPTAVIVKHTNPCGAAKAKTIEKAYQLAYEADKTSAFGGIIGLNSECDEATARLIIQIFVEVVIAPSFSEGALSVFAEKPNIRILVKPDFMEKKDRFDYRQISGGMLVQEADIAVIQKADMKVVTMKAPSENQESDMLFGWALVKYVKSNAIILVKDGVLVGVGAGQMSRIESVELAIKKAGDKAKGSVLISDAFFPFSDSVERASVAGISAIIQPGGSLRDRESI
ncbi:MAG: bifunctional phosphoribosylaminoimidazolecarboxamide formyltransferase/IMP cyclohydrolase, partial [Candidatus Margulisiibacteriota bacterium]